MKKTCNGCKALGKDLGNDSLRCDVGYKTKEEVLMNVVVCLIPLEQCPKPKTWQHYDDCKNEMRRRIK